uniref:Uncharacterized protein n=1 Tax=Moniliophthora roreri TaxID=221103 RepID=A0A0W0FLY2_MONRR
MRSPGILMRFWRLNKQLHLPFSSSTIVAASPIADPEVDVRAEVDGRAANVDAAFICRGAGYCG